MLQMGRREAKLREGPSENHMGQGEERAQAQRELEADQLWPGGHGSRCRLPAGEEQKGWPVTRSSLSKKSRP